MKKHFFLEMWEKINNENSNFTEFSKIKKSSYITRFYLKSQEMNVKTNSIRIISKGGKYSIRTFDDPDIVNSKLLHLVILNNSIRYQIEILKN